MEQELELETIKSKAGGGEDKPGAERGSKQIRLGIVAMRSNGAVLLHVFKDPQPREYGRTLRDHFKARLPSSGISLFTKAQQKQVISTGVAYAMAYSHQTILHALERNLPLPVRIDIDMEEPSPVLTHAFHHTRNHHAPWPIHTYRDLPSVAHALRTTGLPVTIISWPAPKSSETKLV